MIKVLEHGFKTTVTVIRKRCYRCNCLFEFTKEDTQKDRDGVYTVCPDCGTFIRID